jgi:UDP-glucose 4-epimerase
MKPLRILVTGATGFLGTEVVSLCKKKFDVVACARKPKKGVKQTDITKPIKLRGRFDVVIHLAGSKYSKNPKDYYKINTQGTINVLNFCAKAYTKKIVFASTCSVYGQKMRGTITERTKPTKQSDYGKSKALAEKEIIKCNKKQGIGYTIFRFPTLFGRNEKTSRITKIIKDYKKGYFLSFEKNSVFGATYAKDAANLIVQSITKGRGTYNAAAYTTNIKEIIETLNKIKKQNKKICFKNKQQTKLKINSTRAIKQFNFPKYSLKKALNETI